MRAKGGMGGTGSQRDQGVWYFGIVSREYSHPATGWHYPYLMWFTLFFYLAENGKTVLYLSRGYVKWFLAPWPWIFHSIL
jgi:hypothetical protein